MLLKVYHLLKSFPLVLVPPPVNPHIITEPEDTTGRVRSRVSRKSSTPGPSGLNTLSAVSPPGIVNPLSALDPSRLMAALSSLSSSGWVNTPSAASSSHLMAALSSPGPSGLVNTSSAASSSHLMAALSSPGSSGLVNPPSAPGTSDSNSPPPRTMAWRHKRDRQEGKISRTRKAYTCTVCRRPMTSEGHTQ